MNFNMEILKIQLDNDFEVQYMPGSDGGGFAHLPDFKLAMSLTGKEHYTNGVEWCAGFGVLGFDLLNRKVCDRMSFIDCHAPSIEWINNTIKHNHVEEKTATYLTDTISLIPDDVKWDLLIANPPHSFDAGSKKYLEDNTAEPQLSDVLRLTCDVDLLTHREFFASIRKHLLPEADLFISEVGDFDRIEQLAIDAGLEVVARHPADKLSIDSHTNSIVFHFKEPS